MRLWGAFAYGGFLPLQEVMGNLNAMKYQLLLQRVNLSEWGDVYGGSDFLFMQDNAPPHAVSSTILVKFLINNTLYLK